MAFLFNSTKKVCAVSNILETMARRLGFLLDDCKVRTHAPPEQTKIFKLTFNACDILVRLAYWILFHFILLYAFRYKSLINMWDFST